jgi:hypothetical protein
VSVQHTLRRLIVALVVGAALVLPALVSAQGRPDCAQVLREMHNRKVMLHGHGSKRTPDSVRIASQLGVDADWVDRCAESYGRRTKRSEVRGEPSKNENDTDVAEKREEEEYDELAREEKDTLGDKYVTVIENDEQDRKKLERSRQDDDVEESEPEDTHIWEPDLGHPWEPYLHEEDRDIAE